MALYKSVYYYYYYYYIIIIIIIIMASLGFRVGVRDRPTHLLLASNGTVPIPVWRSGACKPSAVQFCQLSFIHCVPKRTPDIFSCN